MSDAQHFYAGSTVTAKALVSDIWAIWCDVNGWPNWDDGLEKTEIRGNFRAGNAFMLQPKGAQPIEVKLTSVTAGEEFADEAILPFGAIRHYHRIEHVGERLKLTHEVHAEINSDAAAFFEKEIWPHMQSGLPLALNNILSIAQAE